MLASHNQIADSSQVILYEGGVLDMGSSTDVVGALHLTEGKVEGSTGVICPTDIFVYQSTSPSAIASKLALGATNHNINVAEGATLEITGLTTGPGGKLTKTDTGKLVLSNANTYSGGTEIQGGTLQVKNDIAVSTSSATGSGPVVVKSGGTLGGAGRIIGNVTVEDGGTVAPGADYGALRVKGNVTLAATSLLNVQLNTPGVTTGGNNDYLKVTGNLTLDGILNINAEQTTPTISNGTYYLITYTGTFTNNGLAWGIRPSGHTYSRQFLAGQFNVKVAP